MTSVCLCLSYKIKKLWSDYGEILRKCSHLQEIIIIFCIFSMVFMIVFILIRVWSYWCLFHQLITCQSMLWGRGLGTCLHCQPLGAGLGHMCVYTLLALGGGAWSHVLKALRLFSAPQTASGSASRCGCRR